MSFADNLRDGLIGEGEISRWLQSRGWTVLPAYETHDQAFKGPQLFRSDGSLVAPDALAIRTDRPCFWFEAKTKGGWSWWRRGRSWQDGIDRHHWRDYQRVDAFLPWDVWLFFLHRNGDHCSADEPPPWASPPPAGLYGERVSFLSDRVDHESDRHGRHGMVYWNACDFRRFSGYPLGTHGRAESPPRKGQQALF